MATPNLFADKDLVRVREACAREANTEGLSILLVEKTALRPVTVKSHWDEYGTVASSRSVLWRKMPRVISL
jgi:hypothetical protein